MPAIIGAHHTSYSVTNMAPSLAFYRDLLGFEVVNERPEVTNTYFRTIIGFPDAVVYAVLLKIPGTNHHLELFEYKHPQGVKQATDRPNNPGSSHIAYLVDDLRALYVRLKAANVQFFTEPVYLDEGPNKGGWAVYMQDPDGIIIELFEVAKK
jgi:catechol 2,3-dioxygenase-like lactoylglutathione lyase family enzyme